MKKRLELLGFAIWACEIGLDSATDRIEFLWILICLIASKTTGKSIDGSCLEQKHGMGGILTIKFLKNRKNPLN